MAHQYLFAVFTHYAVHPYEDSRIQTLITMIESWKKVDSAIVILEGGVNGGNPHLNLIVKFPDGQSNTSYFRKLCKVYYGESAQLPRNALVCKTVDDLSGLLNYLSKEPNSRCVYQKGEFAGFDHEQSKRDYIPPPRVEPTSRFKMITRNESLQTMVEFMVAHDFEIAHYEDFIELIVAMKAQKLILLDVLSRPKHYYAMLLNSEDSNDKLRQILIENGNLN